MGREIARLRERIELESVAMKLALSGFATVAKHEFITNKYNAIGECQERLRTIVGEQEAVTITMDVYGKVMEQEGNQGMQGFCDITTIPIPIRQLESPPLTDEAKAIL